jgi:hypothetical protein
MKVIWMLSNIWPATPDIACRLTIGRMPLRLVRDVIEAVKARPRFFRKKSSASR